MDTKLLLFALTAHLLTSTLAYKHYQYRIPNGDRVDHPCFPNKLWWGVGHFNQAGGGAQNQFGLDFQANGHQWTKALCQKDSDGDGRTNGEELGDPKCVWEQDAVADRTFNVTHPGVCEPITSDKCKKLNGDWKLCVSDKFKCPAIEEPGTIKVTLQFKRTLIPKRVTNYFCQAFELPTNDTYHIIANQPILDNANVMHHILIFGCDSKPDEKLFQAPHRCGMGGSQCTKIIGIWALGYLGECFSKDYGMLVGKEGYKHVVLQYHWNNPGMLSNQYDATAMIIYLSNKLRPNNGGVFTAGQRYLKIPAGKSVVMQNAVCSANCTKKNLPHKIFLTDIVAHMHYLGRKAAVTQYRNGRFLRKILPLSEVRYDAPQKFNLDPPMDFLPGDQLESKCEFRSTGKKDTVYYGDATQDEMCYMFINFYPSQKFTWCINYGEVDTCTLNTKENGGDGARKPGWIEDCHLGNFLDSQGKLATAWMPKINEFCDFSINECQAACLDVVKDMTENEPCWHGWPRKYINFLSSKSKTDFDILKRVRLATAACERKLVVMAVEKKPDPGKETDEKDGNGGGKNQTVLIVVACVAVFALLAGVTMIGLMRAFSQRQPKRDDRAQIVDNPSVQGQNEVQYDNPSYGHDIDYTAAL